MAITQLTTFELLPSQTSTSTSLTSSPLNHLLTSLCARQSVYSAYPVNLYTDLHSSGVFYLLSGWRDPSSISTWRKDLEDVNTIHGGACSKLRDFVKIRGSVYLDMDFDRIPRGVQGNGRVLCVLRNLIGRDGADDEDDEEFQFDDGHASLVTGPGQGCGLVVPVSGMAAGTLSIDSELSLRRPSASGTQPSDDGHGVVDSSDDSDSDTEEPCRIEWIGGGHDLRILEQSDAGAAGRTFHSFMMYNEGTSERALQGKLGRRIRSRDFTAMKRISIPRPVMVSTDPGVGYSFRTSEQLTLR
ncbi:hypothetical protein L218DRAFT_961714 [Marasmius fiardii PR-910]|nr:hypothetical protein L218DRAFT_961714 [Marasmius fiardii PR-910]